MPPPTRLSSAIVRSMRRFSSTAFISPRGSSQAALSEVRVSIPRRKLAGQFARDRAVIDLPHVVDAGEDHRGVELAAEDIESARHARFTGGAKPIEERPADHAGVRAECERA